MEESFIQFIWRYQKFDPAHLKTTNGLPLCIFNAGNHNHDSGPDFEEARIKIATIEWAGNVEIHVRSSDWDKHQHSKNRAYSSVILHVVWEHDKEILIEGKPVPTLELKAIVNPKLIHHYKTHIDQPEPIACASQNSARLNLSFLSMFDKLLVERLERKAEEILDSLKETKNNWEEACYRTLAANFGFSTNKHAFYSLSKKIPFYILKKNLSSVEKTEALLFGQAGFLEDPMDEFHEQRKNEFEFLRVKFSLSVPINKHEWKFGRMRPANFPSIRIAQFASLLSSRPRLFTELIDDPSHKAMLHLLDVSLPEYWKNHYDFGKKRVNAMNKAFGKSSKDILLINTFAPILAAYAKHTGDHSYLDRAVSLLAEIPPEQNNVTKHWTAIGRQPQNAFDSQAQIQLFNEYCKKRKCLSCAIGVSLLNN